MKKEIIVGLHSIIEAINNTERGEYSLYGTDDGLSRVRKEVKAFDKILGRENVKVFKSNHDFQTFSKKTFTDFGFKPSRIMNGVFLICNSKKFIQVGEVFDKLKDRSDVKIICLDQVTDPQNAAAVVRTAAFFGVDYLILPGKSSSAHSPGFYRTASGGAEHLKIIYVSNLSRFITRCNDLGAICVGFSEHKDKEVHKDETANKNIVLVMGNEEKGISNAVMRNLQYFSVFKSSGKIKSLNVSVASAIAMEKFFG